MEERDLRLELPLVRGEPSSTGPLRMETGAGTRFAGESISMALSSALEILEAETGDYEVD